MDNVSQVEELPVARKRKGERDFATDGAPKYTDAKRRDLNRS
jgi:hypothetical protein